MEFFIRMYAESGATLADFARVSTLTTSQVRLILGKGALDYQSTESDANPKTFFALKQEFEQAGYEQVRDRQMKEMEIEDDLMSKLPVR
jgi:engulfment/cell motility protein 1